jgi:hypothetical protein
MKHAMQTVEGHRDERLALARARIAEAESDPRPSLSEAEVQAHFAAKLARAIAERRD